MTSDADVRVPNDFCGVVQTLKDPQMELASCVYLGTADGGLAAQLDAVGKSVEMLGGACCRHD